VFEGSVVRVVGVVIEPGEITLGNPAMGCGVSESQWKDAGERGRPGCSLRV